MFDNYKAYFSGSNPDDNNFSPYDLYALTEVYNKSLHALDEVIIPYVSDKLNATELKNTLSDYQNADFLGAINKLVSGLALMRARNSDGNIIAPKLLAQYEDFFYETKRALENLRYDFAFASVIAFDRFCAELKNFVRSSHLNKENRYQIKELERIVNIIKSDLGDYAAMLTGNIDFDDASDITHLLHTHNAYLRVHSLAACIIKFNEIKKMRTNKLGATRQFHENKQAHRAVAQSAAEIAYMHEENNELRKQLVDAEKRIQKRIDDDALLEQIFGDTEKDKEIAELKRQIDALTKENMNLRANQKYKLFGRRR